jgi:biopolymer transport protein ExbD
VAWNGTPVAGMDQLEGYFHNSATKEPQPEIHLRPDRRARYGVVAQVLAAAQRNRMVKIGFTNVAEFSN